MVPNVPAIEPAVEMAESLPAAAPIVETSRAASRTANVVTMPSRVQGAAKSASAARSDRNRSGTGASAKNSITGAGAAKMSQVRTPDATRRFERTRLSGRRSASRPPSAAPAASDARKTVMSEPQTKIEVPKTGARTRAPTISRPISAAPARKTAASSRRISRVVTRGV